MIVRTAARLGEDRGKSKGNPRERWLVTGFWKGRQNGFNQIALCHRLMKHIRKTRGSDMNCKRRNERAWAVLAIAGLALSACGGGGGGGDRVYDLAANDARSKISGKQSSYKVGEDTRTMRVASSGANGLRVTLPHAGSFESACLITFEQVSESQTRITPDCGGASSTAGDTLMAFFEMEIDAHVRKMLTGAPIDGEKMARQQVLLIAANASSIVKEGGEDFELEERARDATIRRVENQQEGWGDDAAAADGWGN